jgi:exopolyphosphatase/guanosine-5'-triphosphate,3'-diphosphate pyrophosphatase
MNSERIVAFMDIGTNSLRLLLVRINPNRSYTVLTDQKEIVRLGEGEFVDRYLKPEAMQRAALVARNFAVMARAYNVEEIIAVATSATREAENQDEFIRLLKREAQLKVHTISGREEARLIYLGVVNGVHLDDQQAVFIDIGGGSTEVIVGGQLQYHHLDSLKLGAIRLTSLFFLPGEEAAVSEERYSLIKNYVRNASVRTVQQVKQHKFELAFGSSGTIENLADMAILNSLNRRRERDDTLTFKHLREMIDILCDLPLSERRKVPGINPQRADIIIAGAAIIDVLMQELEIEDLHISERGLRDGLLIDYLSRKENQPVLVGESVRARSILQLARTCGVDEQHARHVASLALELFDCARQLKLHRFGNRERELLEYAALVHDVGIFLSYSNHQQHSYYLIRNADLLGFDQTEISLLAAAALFHRKAMPRKKKHPEFALLDKKSQRTVRLFAMLLRLAENLDRSHTGAIDHACFREGDNGAVVLDLQANHACQLELWGLQAHYQSFEKIFKRKMFVEARMNGQDITALTLPTPGGAGTPVD